MEIGNLPEKEFRMIVRMIQDLGNGMEKIKEIFIKDLEKWFPGSSDSKESACNAKDSNLIHWVGEILWRRQGLPIPILWPGEFHRPRSLVGYSPWGGMDCSPWGGAAKGGTRLNE